MKKQCFSFSFENCTAFKVINMIFSYGKITGKEDTHYKFIKSHFMPTGVTKLNYSSEQANRKTKTRLFFTV